jgi:hypothetical protein
MSNANFEAPKIGNGQQMGDGNVEETLEVGTGEDRLELRAAGAAHLVGFIEILG